MLPTPFRLGEKAGSRTLPALCHLLLHSSPKSGEELAVVHAAKESGDAEGDTDCAYSAYGNRDDGICHDVTSFSIGGKGRGATHSPAYLRD